MVAGWDWRSPDRAELTRQLGDIRRDPPGFIPREQVGGIGRWVRPRLILDIRDGAIPAKGARYEDVSLDHRTAFGGLAGRSAATATTGPWCRRPDKQFDPSKHRPYMY